MDKDNFLNDLLNGLREKTLLAIYNDFADVNNYEIIYTDVEDVLGNYSFLDGWNRLADPRTFNVNADFFYCTGQGIKSTYSIKDVCSIMDLAKYLERYGDKGHLKDYEDKIMEGFSAWAIKSLKNDNPNEVDIHVLKESYLNVFVDYNEALTRDWEDLLEEQIELYLEDQEEGNE